LRPYVLINVAATVDGKIDTVERRGAAISSDADRARVDALRASADAVMVGTRTLLDEDPRLTIRSPELRAQRVARGKPQHPAKVSLLRDMSALNPASRFLTHGPARVILFTPSGDALVPVQPTADPDRSRRQPADAGMAGMEVEVYRCGEGRVDLVAAFEQLARLGIERLLVEGGGRLNFELLRLGLVDEIQVYLAPLILGGGAAPTLADGAGLSRDQALRLTRTSVEPRDDGGVLLRYRL
jgi:2,5-diamino-6-(ribosylamino)-4(3H)-pyrimidinone 5'-phosphate reductase